MIHSGTGTQSKLGETELVFPKIGLKAGDAIGITDQRDLWTKWDRFKQAIGIFFRPWKVWELHDEIEMLWQIDERHQREAKESKQQITDLIEDLRQVSKQRDEISSITRRQMLKK